MTGWILFMVTYLIGAAATARVCQASITPGLWGLDTKAKVAVFYVKIWVAILFWFVLAIMLAIGADEFSPVKDGRREREG